MFCTQCGYESPDTARFCKRCGAALISPDNAIEPAVIVPEVKATRPVTEEKPKKVKRPSAIGKKSRITFIVCLALLVISYIILNL